MLRNTLGFRGLIGLTRRTSGTTIQRQASLSVTIVPSGAVFSTHFADDAGRDAVGSAAALKSADKHDVNRDGVVNILDLVAVANGFGKTAPDINGDCIVNILDLVLVARQFGL